MVCASAPAYTRLDARQERRILSEDHKYLQVLKAIIRHHRCAGRSPSVLNLYTKSYISPSVSSFELTYSIWKASAIFIITDLFNLPPSSRNHQSYMLSGSRGSSTRVVEFASSNTTRQFPTTLCLRIFSKAKPTSFARMPIILRVLTRNGL
jgi:hypothetical protein